jgi:BMFP domain-containing protein YqiC
MNNTKETTSSYIELAGQASNLVSEAMATANKRALDYWKSVWEISSRPYASTAIESSVRENFDRANQILALTVSEMQTSAQKTSELTERLASHTAKLQDTALTAFGGMVNTGVSNLNYVKETTNKQFDEMAKRADELKSRAVPVSQN